MGVSDKLTKQAGERLGEPVEFATMIVPPGATLYRGYSPSSTVGATAGPILEAIASKSGDRSSGRAGEMPRQMGVLGVTADRVVFFKKKLVGTGCGELLASWPRSAVAGASYGKDGRWSYPGVLIEFDDGTDVVIYGEERWNLDGLAAVLAPASPPA